jgi:hypothetical protein
MKKKISGNRYSFLIEFVNSGKEYIFQILCLYKEENTKSTITNLNFIISELIIPILKTSDIDSIVSLNRIKGNKLFIKSISSFKNKSWIAALEKSLDEDRTLGGWNSNYEF